VKIKGFDVCDETMHVGRGGDFTPDEQNRYLAVSATGANRKYGTM